MLNMMIFGISKQFFAKKYTCASSKNVTFGLRSRVPNETFFPPVIFVVDLCYQTHQWVIITVFFSSEKQEKFPMRPSDKTIVFYHTRFCKLNVLISKKPQF